MLVTGGRRGLPRKGGSGPQYDRRLLAATSSEPIRFLAYLAVTFTLHRGGRVDLDLFTRAVHAGLPAANPAAHRKRRPLADAAALSRTGC